MSKLRRFLKLDRLPKGTLVQLGVLLVISLSVAVTIQLVKNFVLYKPQAAAPTANLYFSPSTVSVPVDQTVRLKLNASSGIGFARVDIPFDKTKVKITGIQFSNLFLFSPDPNLTWFTLPTAVTTTPDQANSAGKMTFIFELKTAYQANAPVGDFDLATITLAANTTISGQTALLDFDKATLQVVDMSGYSNTDPNKLMTLTTANLNVAVNPSATPTPRPTLTNTPTPRPTNTPTPRPTLTNTPTPVPSSTATPRPTAANTPTPNLTNAPVAGDINRDGIVNMLDYNILSQNWGLNPPTDIRADINGDGAVNMLDYNILSQNWGKTS